MESTRAKGEIIVADPRPAGTGSAAVLSLLSVTVLGTMSNNMINVPLRGIAVDLGAPVAQAVLCVIAFSLFLAVAMPITGWLGDRLGRKRVLCSAVVLMGLAQVAAALAPNMGFLILTRGLQGLGCSAIPPIVMGLLVWMRPGQPGKMMGAWAAANGIGQAAGPPIGGVISDALNWRAIFVLVAIGSALVLAVIVRKVPADNGRDARFHVAGALLLTSGVGLVLAGTSGISQPGVPYWLDGVLVGLGGVLGLAFVLVSRGNPKALVPLRDIVDVRFARSAMAMFAQMFMLGTALVSFPLFLTGPLQLSASVSGAIFFALPVAMAVMAPMVGWLIERWHPRPVLRIGLATVILSAAGAAWLTSRSAPSLVATACLLVVLGVGMSLVQTPAATGAARSPAGRHGAALGLFNLIRFSGSTAGAAWVALMVPAGRDLALYLGCLAIAGLALVFSFAGPNPVTPPRTPGTSTEAAQGEAHRIPSGN